MKKFKLIIAVSFLSIAFLISGCDNDDGVSSHQGQEIKVGSTASPKAQFAQKKQMDRLQKAGINTENLDAYFSLGWTSYPAYDSTETINEIYSFGYAGAFDEATYKNFDMGDVAVSYGSDKTDFNKYEYEFTYTDEQGNVVTEKDIFYDLYKFPMTEEEIMDENFLFEEVELPYFGGQDYVFTATGSDEFPAVTISVTAPAEQLEITEPKSDVEIDLNTPLTIKWQGGQGTSQLFLSVYPMLDWENISEDDWDSIDEEFDFDFGVFKEVDANTGEYTLTPEEMKSISEDDLIIGLFIDVYNYNVVSTNEGGKNIVAELHLGNSIEALIK